MLEAALKVVEAARELRLVRKDGRTLSELPHLDLALAIDGLRLAIETFDRETSEAVSGPVLQPKPEWASPPQMDDDGFREKQLLLSDDPRPAPEMEPEPGMEGEKPEPEPEPRESRKPKAVPEALALRIKAAAGPGTPGLDMGEEGVFFDGDESAADLMLSIGSINDKLGYAVGKVGWSPRLRALAEAARIAQNNMYIEVENGNQWVRVPAANWGTLSVAIAEAALDQDLSIALPHPAPREPAPLPAPKPPGFV